MFEQVSTIISTIIKFCKLHDNVIKMKNAMELLKVIKFYRKSKNVAVAKSINDVSKYKVTDTEQEVLEDLKNKIQELTIWQTVYIAYCICVKLTNYDYKSVFRNIKEYFIFW